MHVGRRSSSAPAITRGREDPHLPRFTGRSATKSAHRSTQYCNALAARKPFVLSFATPQFCQTRVCGPVVDVVSAVRRELAGSGTRFIHVEIYRDNDPAKGTNRWVKEWNLQSEPFTFVVDRTGVVRTRLEGAFSPAELERAVGEVAP